MSRLSLVVGAIAIALLMLAACGGGSSHASTSGPPAIPHRFAHDTELAAGRVVFRNYCAECHGMHGQGGLGARLANHQAAEDFPTLEQQITFIENGKGIMPAWKNRLPAAKIRAVARYEREIL